MKCKFSLLLFLCVLSLWGQAQSLNLQELVNKKQFQEVVARADSLTPADSADYATMSAIGQAYEGLLRNEKSTDRPPYSATVLHTPARLPTL